MSNENPNLKDLHYKVGCLTGNIQQMDKNIDQRFCILDKRLDALIRDHENRINKVESDCDNMKGRAAAIGGVAGFFVATIGLIITWFKN